MSSLLSLSLLVDDVVVVVIVVAAAMEHCLERDFVVLAAFVGSFVVVVASPPCLRCKGKLFLFVFF